MAGRSSKQRHWAIVLCYGTFGFGYIIQATFLPAMARQQVSDPRVFGLTWPLFGLAAAVSVAGAARWLAAWPRRRVWALAQGVHCVTAYRWFRVGGLAVPVRRVGRLILVGPLLELPASGRVVA